MSNYTQSTGTLARALRPWIALAVTAVMIALMLLLHVVQQRTVPTNATPPSAYTAGVQNGRVVIYTGETLSLVTDIYISTLPNADRKLLAAGVSLDSDAALARLLEDYGS